MDPILIMMGVFALGLYGCYRWMMHLIRNDKDVKINSLTKDGHGAQ
jgi:hypothetical protein